MGEHPSKEKSIILLGRAASFVAPIVGFSSVLLSIAYSPWFSWDENALSDLGVSGTGSRIFNIGLVITGSVTILFALGLATVFSRVQVGQLGAGFLFLNGLFLSSIGLFPETSGIIHLYVSIGFFATLAISILMVSAQVLLTEKNRPLGLLSIGLVLVGIIGWFLPHQGEAIPEAISGLIGSAWSILVGIRLLGEQQDYSESAGKR